jgi:hypothetical protein
MGRKQHLEDSAVIFINTEKVKSKLQLESHRRALIQLLVDSGGRMRVAAINEHFNFECRSVIRSLLLSGWVGVKE